MGSWVCQLACSVDVQWVGDVQDSEGLSAAQLAANQGHVEVVGRILDASRDYMHKGFSALHLAVQNGLDRLVQQLLVLPGTTVDAPDADGATALHWAAAEGETLPPSSPYDHDQEQHATVTSWHAWAHVCICCICGLRLVTPELRADWEM